MVFEICVRFSHVAIQANTHNSILEMEFRSLAFKIDRNVPCRSHDIDADAVAPTREEYHDVEGRQ